MCGVEPRCQTPKPQATIFEFRQRQFHLQTIQHLNDIDCIVPINFGTALRHTPPDRIALPNLITQPSIIHPITVVHHSIHHGSPCCIIIVDNLAIILHSPNIAFSLFYTNVQMVPQFFPSQHLSPISSPSEFQITRPANTT